MSRLASFHYTAQMRPEKKHFAQYGLDLASGTVRNNVEAGVLEPVLAKIKIVQVKHRKIRHHVDVAAGRYKVLSMRIIVARWTSILVHHALFVQYDFGKQMIVVQLS